MQAVILAGGHGHKLRPLTFETPKPLLPLINRPILSYVMAILAQAGVSHCIVVTDYLGEQIEAFIQDNTHPMLVDVHHLSQFQGTAQILVEISDQLDDSFLVVGGDCVFDLDLSQAIQTFQSKKADLGLVVRKEPDILGRGGLKLSGSTITEIVSSQNGHDLVSDAWIYYMTKTCLSLVPDQERFDIHLDLVQACLDKKLTVEGVEFNGFWAVVGRIHPFLAANFWLLQNISQPAYQAPSAEVDPSAILTPPYFIDENVKIGANARLGPNVILNANVSVGAGAKLDNTLVGPGTKIGARADISTSAIATDCKLDEQVVLRPFAIVADRCQIGAKSCLESGTRIGPRITVPAQTTITDICFPKGYEYPPLFSTFVDLDDTELTVCMALKRAGEQPLQGLSHKTGLSTQDLQDALDKLVSSNWVVQYGENPIMYSLVEHA